MKSTLLSLMLILSISFAYSQSIKTDKYASRRFFVLQFTQGANWEAGVPMSRQKLGDHRAFYQKLLEAGKVVIGGGFLDREQGLSILKVRDRAEADSIVRVDPAVISGIFKIEVIPLFAVFKSKNDEQLDLNGLVFKQ